MSSEAARDEQWGCTGSQGGEGARNAARTRHWQGTDAIQPSAPSPPIPNCSIPWDTQVILMGHSRVPAPQCPHGQHTKHLFCTICPRFRAHVLLKRSCCLPSEAEMNTSPNSSPTPRRKRRNCPWVCIGPSQEWPVGRKGLSPRTALVQAGFLQLVKHSYPL